MSLLREQLAAFFPERHEYVARQPKAPRAAADESMLARLSISLSTPAPLLTIAAPADHAAGRTRTALHATARLVGKTGMALAEVQEQAISLIETGLAQSFPVLKDSFLPGFALDVDFPAFRARAERHVQSRAWAIRVDQALPETPGAVLRVQAGVATRFDRDGVATAVYFATRVAVGGHAPEAARLAVPNFVHTLGEFGLTCASLALTGVPWHVSGDESDDFIRFLEHSARHVAVLAVGRQASGWRLDAEALAAAAQGYAVIAVLSDEAILRVVEVLGKEHAVLAGSARLYAAGYHRSQPPYRHPLYLRNSLRHHFLHGQDTHAMLWQAVLDHSVASDFARPFVPFVDALASRNRDVVREASYAALDGPEAGAPEGTADEVDAPVLALEDTVRELRVSLRQAKEQMRIVHADKARLETALEERLARRAALPVPIPTGWTDLGAWAGLHLKGRLVLTPRALASAERALFEDSDLVYEALCLLAFEYRDMCLGGPREPFQTRMTALGLDESRSVTEYGATSEYYVDYQGTRTFLERHLKRGNARDERRCLRIYFFWDKREQVVVVGHMPDHLTTRQS
jgi:hypothetical protein